MTLYKIQGTSIQPMQNIPISQHYEKPPLMFRLCLVLLRGTAVIYGLFGLSIVYILLRELLKNWPLIFNTIYSNLPLLFYTVYLLITTASNFIIASFLKRGKARMRWFALYWLHVFPGAFGWFQILVLVHYIIDKSYMPWVISQGILALITFILAYALPIFCLLSPSTRRFFREI